MSADVTGSLREANSINKFILDKDSNSLDSKYKVFLYSSLGPIKRMFGYSIIGYSTDKVYKWTEFNFQPFGYFLTEDSPPAEEFMLDITDFKNYKFNEEIIIRLRTPYLIVDSPLIGTYK